MTALQSGNSVRELPAHIFGPLVQLMLALPDNMKHDPEPFPSDPTGN